MEVRPACVLYETAECIDAAGGIGVDRLGLTADDGIRCRAVDATRGLYVVIVAQVGRDDDERIDGR
ncbi:MAG TPA: hypothetical protein VJ745_03775, partial [Gaiellaceae bacterium]|nr:hypothetical protein [Gaiellaceae bacterium]